MIHALGKNCLHWCYTCNMPVVSANKCPICKADAKMVQVSPPWDLRPAFRKDIELIRSLADEEYGVGCGKDLIPDDRVVILNDNSRGKESVEIVINGYVVGVIRFKYDMRWHISLDAAGFRMILPHLRKRWVVASHSGQFMMKKTTNLLVKGVNGCDSDSRQGDKVAVLSTKGEFISCGTLCMDPSEIATAERGLVVRVKETNKGRSGSDTPVNWKDTLRWNGPMMERKISEAKAFIRKTIKDHPDIPHAVSFSGGKDSQAVLMLFNDAGIKT